MKKIIWRSAQGVGIFFVSLIVLFLMVGVFILSQIPSAKTIRGCVRTKLYEIELCPSSKEYTKLKDVSPYVAKAIILTEDSAFYTHHGFDFAEIQKSMEKNLATGKFARGGSTITQQLAKNMFLTADKTIQRKILEAIITLQIEKTLSKNEIIERYLNVVEFGPEIYGIKAAADFYFNKTPAKLDVIEAAWMAFLLPSPDKYSVSFYKRTLTPFARKRLREIIQRLYQYSRINAGEYELAERRLGSFLTGAAPPKAPPGMDLNAPEEDFDYPLLLEPLDHPVDGVPSEQKSEDHEDPQIYEQPIIEPSDE